MVRLASDCLVCIAFRLVQVLFVLWSVAIHGGVYTTWSLSCFSFTAVAKFHMHHRRGKLQDGVSWFLALQPATRFQTVLHERDNDPPSRCLVPRSAKFETPRIVVILTLPSGVSLSHPQCWRSNVPKPVGSSPYWHTSSGGRVNSHFKNCFINLGVVADVNSQIFEHRDCSKSRWRSLQQSVKLWLSKLRARSPRAMLVESSMWEPSNSLDDDVLLRVIRQPAWSESVNTTTWDGSSTCCMSFWIVGQWSIWRLVWAPPSFQLLAHRGRPIQSVVRTVEHSQVNSRFRFLTRRGHFVMNSSVWWATQRVVGQLRTQYVHVPIRMEVWPILFNIRTSVTSPSAVQGPSVARCLRAPHHKVVAVSEHIDVSCAGMTHTQSENVPVSKSIAVMAFSLATSKHCAASYVPYTVLCRRAYTLLHSSSSRGTLITIGCETVLCWCRRIPELSRQRVPAGCQSCIDWAWTWDSSGGVAANVLPVSSGVNSLTLLVSCATSLARMNGFPASSSDGFRPRLVQVAHKNFMVNLQFTHENQLFLDSISLHFGIKRQSSSFVMWELVQIHVHSSARSAPLHQSVQLRHRQWLQWHPPVSVVDLPELTWPTQSETSQDS